MPIRRCNPRQAETVRKKKEHQRRMKTSFIALSLMVSGLAFAQDATTQTAPRHARGNPDQRFEQRLAQRLSLTAAQQNVVHSTRAESRVQSQGMNEKMHTLRTSLNA